MGKNFSTPPLRLRGEAGCVVFGGEGDLVGGEEGDVEVVIGDGEAAGDGADEVGGGGGLAVVAFGALAAVVGAAFELGGEGLLSGAARLVGAHAVGVFAVDGAGLADVALDEGGEELLELAVLGAELLHVGVQGGELAPGKGVGLAELLEGVGEVGDGALREVAGGFEVGGDPSGPGIGVALGPADLVDFEGVSEGGGSGAAAVEGVELGVEGFGFRLPGGELGAGVGFRGAGRGGEEGEAGEKSGGEGGAEVGGGRHGVSGYVGLTSGEERYAEDILVNATSLRQGSACLIF